MPDDKLPSQRRNPITHAFMGPDDPMPSRCDIAIHHTKRLLKDPIGQLIVVLVVGFIIASLAASGVITMKLAWGLLFLAWVVPIGGSFFLGHLWQLHLKHRLRLSVLLAILLGAIGFYEQSQQAPPPSQEALVAQQDLAVNFNFKDWQQIGQGELNLDYVIQNNGGKSVNLTSIYIIEVYFRDLIPSLAGLSACNIPRLQRSAKYASFGTNVTDIIEGFQVSSIAYAPVFTAINSIKTEATGLPIEPGKRIVLRADYKTNPIPRGYPDGLVVAICPVIRVYDSTGHLTDAVCRGKEVVHTPDAGGFDITAPSSDLPAARILPRDPAGLTCALTEPWGKTTR